MKKILALVCVCAGLTAFAAPKVSHATGNMVTKSNTLFNQLTAPAMKMAQAQNLTFQEFAKTHDMKANMVRNQNASRRGAADVIMGTKVVMLDAYDCEFTSTGCNITPAAYEYMGGWETEFMESEADGYVTVDGIYYTLPCELIADYANEAVAMPSGIIQYTYQGNRVYKNRVYQDTTELVCLVNEGWLQDDVYEDVLGEIWEDGTVYFEDGWAYLFVDIVNTYASKTDTTPRSSDTSMSLSNVFRNTYFLVPNATHSYYSVHAETEAEVPCYMYQYDDTTAVVWNIFGMGYRGVVAFIYGDGTMVMPTYQIMAQDDMSSYAQQYTQYDWTGAEDFYMVAYDLELDDIDQMVEQFNGSCTSTMIKWDEPTSAVDFMTRKSDGASMLGVYFYPWTNNVINFKDGYEFYFPVEIQDLAGEIIIGDVTEDGKVNIQYTGEEDVTLEIIDQDGNSYTPDEDGNIQLPEAGDYTIIVTASAEGYNDLEASKEITWEAATGLRGDVNGDGSVDPSDISALIDYLLNGSAVNEGNSDCDLNGSIDPGDISALIDFLLNSVWPN